MEVQHVKDHRVIGVRQQTVIYVWKTCRINGQTVHFKGPFCASCNDYLISKEIGTKVEPSTRVLQG